jgi:alpha-tubulin suppressor-like RCC1 family protein/chitodextrinase
VIKMSAFAGHTAVIKTNKTLWTFGNNENGQLGHTTNSGTTNPNPTPKQVMTNVKYVAIGDNHTVVLKEDNTVWTFGANNAGQLGHSTNFNQWSNVGGKIVYPANPTPKQVMTDAKFIATSGPITYVIKNDNSLWGFGLGNYGALGPTVTDKTYTPIKIMDDVKSVAVGNNHVIILKNDGSVYTAGVNESGQLGHNANTNMMLTRNELQQVATGVKAVFAVGNISYIIKQDNSLWGCGNGTLGQLGPSNKNVINPSFVKIMDDVKAVAGGRDHVLVLKNDNSVWAAGSNEFGQLGHNTNVGRYTANDYVKIADNVASIGAGFAHSIIVTTMGDLITFGLNDFGQLGHPLASGNPMTPQYEQKAVYYNINAIAGDQEIGKLSNIPTRQEDRFEIEPVNTTLLQTAPGLNFTTKMFFTDGTFVDVTYATTFTASNICAIAEDFGFVKPNAKGTVTITGKFFAYSADATLQVTDSMQITLSLLEVTPNLLYKKPGETEQLSVTGYYNDGSHKDETNNVTWTSDNQNIATVSNTGLVTAVNPGSTYIRATLNGISDLASITVTAPVDNTPPGEVSNLTAINVTHNQITLTWTNPSDSDFSHVNIYEGGLLVAANVTGTSKTFTSLHDSTPYNYIVRTVDKSGNVSQGVSITVTTASTPTQTPDTTPPGEVSNITTSGVAHNELTLNWINPTDNDFSHVNIYEGNTLVSGNVTGTSKKLTGLQPGTTYNFAIKTVDTSGNESAGVPISVTTITPSNDPAKWVQARIDNLYVVYKK